MRSLLFLLLPFLTFNAHSQSNNFSDCTTIKQDHAKTLSCLRKHFINTSKQRNYIQAIEWLEQQESRSVFADTFYSANEVLTLLLCDSNEGGYQGSNKLSDSQKAQHRNSIINLIEQLLTLGASFTSMDTGEIITPLYCVVNRQDSELLDFVLTRTNIGQKELDSCLYEGYDLEHIPLLRTVQNNDPGSTQVLLKHGASPDFTFYKLTEFRDYPEAETTPLLLALKSGHIEVANHLLDAGASVHEGDFGTCEGLTPLEAAEYISEETEKKTDLVARIKAIAQSPPNPCQ